MIHVPGELCNCSFRKKENLRHKRGMGIYFIHVLILEGRKCGFRAEVICLSCNNDFSVWALVGILIAFAVACKSQQDRAIWI